MIIARLAALAAIFTGLAGVVITVFRTQVDRLQANRARSVAVTTGTRLAARFPTMPVYCGDPDARIGDDATPIVGRLRSYRMAPELGNGTLQDVWERAARLIHERYRGTLGPQPQAAPARLPWNEVDDFYRSSNRRQVRNALWMVEQIAGHTWTTWGTPPTPLTVSYLAGLSPLKQLERMGFDADTATAMTRAEHEDWCRYYRHHGWKYGPQRDDAGRVHNWLVDWSTINADPARRGAMLR